MYCNSPRSIQNEAGGTDHINNNPRATHTETEMGVADRAETRVNHRTTEAGGADHNTEKQRSEKICLIVFKTCVNTNIHISS